jgi:hypothetical protein
MKKTSVLLLLLAGLNATVQAQTIQPVYAFTNSPATFATMQLTPGPDWALYGAASLAAHSTMARCFS